MFAYDSLFAVPVWTLSVNRKKKKACAFNIAGMWRSEATSGTNPVFYGFRHDARVTVFGHVPDVLPHEFEMMASVGYKLDNPSGAQAH